MKSKNQDEKSAFMHKFHNQSMYEGLQLLEQDIRKQIQTLVSDFESYLSDTFDSRLAEFQTD